MRCDDDRKLQGAAFDHQLGVPGVQEQRATHACTQSLYAIGGVDGQSAMHADSEPPGQPLGAGPGGVGVGGAGGAGGPGGVGVGGVPAGYVEFRAPNLMFMYLM